MLTSVGQRVDIARAFRAAGAITLGVDADPLAPALYHCDRHAIVPRIADAEYVPALAARNARAMSTRCPTDVSMTTTTRERTPG